MNTNHTPPSHTATGYWVDQANKARTERAELAARVAELEAALRLIAASIISADHVAEYMRGVARAALANKGEKA